MYKKTLLHVSIRCEEVNNISEVYQQLFQHIKKVYTTKTAPRVFLHIDDLDTQEEMMGVLELLYDTVVTTTVPFKIINSYHLYSTLVAIIELSLEQLQLEGFHRAGDNLVIFVSPTGTDDMSYNFKWSFKAEISRLNNI